MTPFSQLLQECIRISRRKAEEEEAESKLPPLEDYGCYRMTGNLCKYCIEDRENAKAQHRSAAQMARNDPGRFADEFADEDDDYGRYLHELGGEG